MSFQQGLAGGCGRLGGPLATLHAPLEFPPAGRELEAELRDLGGGELCPPSAPAWEYSWASALQENLPSPPGKTLRKGPEPSATQESRPGLRAV